MHRHKKGHVGIGYPMISEISDDQPMGFCSFEAMRFNRALLEGQVCCPKGLKWTLQAGGGSEFMGISQGN
jgi:hypothetical protein